MDGLGDTPQTATTKRTHAVLKPLKTLMSTVPFAMFPHVLGWDDLPDLY